MNVKGVKDTLTTILGPDKVSDDPKTLEKYSRDQGLVPSRLSQLVVFPTTDEEVQEVVRLANLEKFPVIPYSSGALQQGTTVPRVGGVVVDLSRMNKIIDFDVENRTASIEPGVTYEQLQREANKKGLRVCTAVGLPASASVLSSYIELVPLYSWAKYGTWFLLPFEVVLPTGEKMGAGSWAWANATPRGASPVAIGAGLTRLFYGSQGSMGILTKGRVVLKNLNESEEVYFFPCDDLNSITPKLHKILRVSDKGLGEECFIVDRRMLLQIVEKYWPETSSATVNLPAWTVVLVLSGPKGEVDYQREDLLEYSAKQGLAPRPDLPGIPDAGRKVLEEMRMPKGFYQSDRYSYHPIQFYISAKFIPQTFQTFQNFVAQYDYAPDKIGYLLLPVEKGRVYYCEYGIHCDKNDRDECAKVRQMFIDAARELLDVGAFISRPYGPLEDVVFSRSGAYHGLVKDLKGMLDPNNIMNTGRIC